MTGEPEFEELPPQRVAPRGNSRPGLAGALAIAGVAVLLAAGFGVLGGRPQAPPAGPTGAVAAAPSPTEIALDTDVRPLVTPFATCAPPADGAAPVMLEVDGQDYPGIEGEPAPTSGQIVRVPFDAVSHIWIGGGVCARGWTIQLASGDVFDSKPLSTAPGAFAQNRFDINLSPYAGTSQQLIARLEYGKITDYERWSLEVNPLELPTAQLQTGERRTDPLVGCELQVQLWNGAATSFENCPGSPGQASGNVLRLRAADRMEFAVAGSTRTGEWRLTGANVTCGQLSSITLDNVPDARCTRDLAQELDDTLAMHAPGAGRWTLGIDACAHDGRNTVCGTWYVDIDVS